MANSWRHRRLVGSFNQERRSVHLRGSTTTRDAKVRVWSHVHLDSSLTSPFTRYILRTYNNLEGHLQDINFAHLAYYASFIQELTASTTVIPGRLILLLSHMLPDGRHLFPRLKRLCWYDGHSPVGGLRAQFFDLVRGPRTSSIELLIPTTISSFNCWANEALGMLSNSPHPLSDIHIVASSPLSQSEQLAQRFQRHLVALFAITPGE